MIPIVLCSGVPAWREIYTQGVVIQSATPSKVSVLTQELSADQEVDDVVLGLGRAVGRSSQMQRWGDVMFLACSEYYQATERPNDWERINVRELKAGIHRDEDGARCNDHATSYCKSVHHLQAQHAAHSELSRISLQTLHSLPKMR